MVSSLTGLPAIFVRKQAKAYGTRRLAEGAEVAGKSITLIEDVITTGGAVRDATIALRAEGASAAVVVCAIDRSGTPGGPSTTLASRPERSSRASNSAHSEPARRVGQPSGRRQAAEELGDYPYDYPQHISQRHRH